MAAAKRDDGRQRVTVRMYKHLLGDCFLLRLSEDGRRSHVLIDCGILQNVDGDRALMQAVAADIEATTGGRLDLLVVTHEHHDHISGFAHAADVFFSDRMKIDHLWMAWTENERDPQAQALDARFNRARRALAFAAARADALAADGVDGARDLFGGLENFIGPLDDEGSPGATGRLTGRKVMEMLKQKVRARGVEPAFLEPHSVVETPGPVALRTYVLGPPRAAERLFQDLPRHGPDGAEETYLDSPEGRLALNRRYGIADDLLRVAEGQAAAGGTGSGPFPRRYALSEAEVRAGESASAEWLRARYYEGRAERVDADWLGSAGALALKLDSDTNNTSLVLAFELRSGKVLLFAGDAQVGNWLSWHDADFEPGGTRAEDLLARAVFYKVGHHASHNATLRDRGLELMTGGDLVAMIPVVETLARSQGSKGWNMPYPPLLQRLRELTADRVIRGDEGNPRGRFPKGAIRNHADDLWVEYDISA